MKVPQLEPKYLEELRGIVHSNVDTRRWKPVIFGSRATGQARKTSDIDIGLIGPEKLPDEVHAKLWDELDKSDIPYVMEIVDVSQTKPEFREIALKKVVDL